MFLTFVCMPVSLYKPCITRYMVNYVLAHTPPPPDVDGVATVTCAFVAGALWRTQEWTLRLTLYR